MNTIKINKLLIKFHDKQFHSFDDGCKILVSGYVLPRNSIFDEFKTLKNEALIYELFKKYRSDFIHQVKGMFCIAIQTETQTWIFNDRLGLKKFFYATSASGIVISDSPKPIAEDADLKLNPTTIAIKALLHREVNDLTLFEQVQVSTPASKIEISEQHVTISRYWSPEDIKTELNKKYDIKYFENLLKTNLSNLNSYLHPKNFSITLTGGKDSRTGLCALLNLGIQPIGLTYGDPKSKDAVFAKQLAQTAEIAHHIFEMPRTQQSISETINQIKDLGNPTINFHRAHRFFAFQQLQKISSKNQVYVAGYMAGELLMGIYYDDLVFPEFLTQIWEKNTPLTTLLIEQNLKHNFLKENAINLEEVLNELRKLQTLNTQSSLFETHLHGIFELGIPHHGQDIFLSSTILDYPYPLFLDIDFLDALFQSNYSFKYTDNKTKNIFERYKLYAFNLKLQHRLYPKLSKVPFAKKGNYTTIDYLRGNLYWSAVKVLNFLRDKQKYPPTFVYNAAYYQYVMQELEVIATDEKNPIHAIYDVQEALQSLRNASKLTQEKHWHRYTNIVSSYQYFNNIKHES
jgi:hypothetical protein